MTTTTRSDSDERLAQDPQTSRNGFSQDSLKVPSLPPPHDSVREMISSKKQVKSPPLASVLEKDEETIHSDSAEASSFSKEPEAIDVECHGVVSVPKTTSSAFLEEDGIREELQRVKEKSAANVSEAGDDVHKMEEAVVCISEKKAQEDSDVESLMEAEKRSNDQHQKVERVRVKDNAFVGRRSVNIDLVDDTALLNVVPFSKKAKEVAPRKHKKNGGRRIVVGKGSASNAVEGKELRRIVYSINEMKSMRYAHSADQKKLWSDVYARLVPELVSEYEGLVSLRNQKTAKSYTRESRIGPVSAVPRRPRVNIFVH